MSSKSMTYEEMVAKLKELGIGPGPRMIRPKRDIQATALPSIKKQMELLENLNGLLQAQVKQDHELVLALREKVNRLKHGGGM
jgi:hypothetical protein